MLKVARRLAELNESSTLAVSAKAAQMRAAGVDVISFGAGEPDFDTPEHIKQALKDALDQGRTKYPKPSSGITEAKDAIRRKYRRDSGLDYSPGQIIVTVGCKMACHLALQALVDPGDEVLILSPYWVSYPELVRLAGGLPIVVASSAANGFALPVARLDSAISPRSRVLIVNTPNNPGGFVYSRADLVAAADFARRHDLAVLSDETYDRLTFGDHAHFSFASLSDDAYERTLTLNSASKTYAMTGWRIGFAGGPEPVIKAMSKLESQATSGVATFTQVALARALDAGQEFVNTMRQEFERRGKLMAGRLNRIPNVRCPEPAGAFYCFPDVSAAMIDAGVRDSQELAQRLLAEAHVAVVPGSAFGCEGHIRLSFATGQNQIEMGLDRLENWIRRARLTKG